MSEDWSAISDEVLQALADTGTKFNFIRKIAQPQDPTDTSATQPSSFWVDGIQIKTSKSFLQGGEEVVVAKTLMVAAGDLTPAMNDIVVIGGKRMSVLRVTALSPAEVDLMYKVDVS